ncbi:putative methyltransferase NSUN5 [Platysternon megacephalum]|uniref:Putative methyltransferase NSUN5 n=1 Tax=Platysternon megacephalum TaxID=55544 RepID=A0A4D9DWM5_9SAUR|nr:putative methyltransferase NSUN5 [Platysternon megacephalum]
MEFINATLHWIKLNRCTATGCRLLKLKFIRAVQHPWSSTTYYSQKYKTKQMKQKSPRVWRSLYSREDQFETYVMCVGGYKIVQHSIYSKYYIALFLPHIGNYSKTCSLHLK